MDYNYLHPHALALDPTSAMPSHQQGKIEYMTGRDGTITALHVTPGAKLTRVLHGYDRDGEPIYHDHYFIGGSK